MKTETNTDNWLKYLDPDNLKGNLMFSSLFIASFESFKDYVIREVKFFFNNGFKDGEFIFDPQYNSDVLSKDKSPIKASLLWFVEMGTIDKQDIDIYDELRQYRNSLSHELMNLLFEGLPKELPQKLVTLIELRIKIERWWLLNVEIPTNPDYDEVGEITEDDLTTSSQMLYKLILDLLSDDEKTASYYKNEFSKYYNK